MCKARNKSKNAFHNAVGAQVMQVQEVHEMLLAYVKTNMCLSSRTAVYSNMIYSSFNEVVKLQTPPVSSEYSTDES